MVKITVSTVDSSFEMFIPVASVKALEKLHGGKPIATIAAEKAFDAMQAELVSWFKSGSEKVTGPDLIPTPGICNQCGGNLANHEHEHWCTWSHEED